MRSLVTLLLVVLITCGLMKVGVLTTDDLRILLHGMAVRVATMTEG